jgi:hypothetical protein
MTFQDIAQQACNLVGENDANSLQFAKDRVKDAYRVLWNSFQWPETLVLQQVAVPAGQSSIFTDSSFGEIYNSSWVPSGAGSQLALGTFTQGNATISVANTGTMAVGMLLQAPGVIQQGAIISSMVVNTSITMSKNALASGANNFTAIALPVLNPIPSTFREYQWIVENAPAFLIPNITSVIPHFYYKQSSRGVPFDSLTLPNPISFLCLASAEGCIVTIHGIAIEPVSGLNVEVSEAVAISTSSPNTVVTPSHNFIKILSLTKTAGNGYIIVNVNNSTSTAFVMQQLDGKYEFNQYFFVPTPSTPWFWNLQLKLRAPEFSSMLDTDAPAIQHLEDCLLVYTQHYLLERQRQYGKAQQKLQLADILVQGAKDIARNQEQMVLQIVPDVYDITNLNGWRTRRRTSSFF